MRLSPAVMSEFFGLNRHATVPGPLKLDGGSELAPVEIAYETHGALNADGSNAIMLCHATARIFRISPASTE